jgi:hypothetical protein
MAWRSPYCRYGKKITLLFLALLSAGFLFSQSIFQPTDAPAIPLLNDGQAISFGVKFRSTQDGYITGIRFYKGTGTTGTHTGNLWSSSGLKLAEAVFNESASGWQQVLLASPVAITAGITYVASCYTSSGDYCVTNPYFTQAVVNGPLRALANGEDGPNGVFIVSSVPAFPNNNFQTINYWVDVVFNTTTGPDITPPLVSSVSPAAGTAGVSLNTGLTAVFNEALDPSTVNSSTFELRNASGSLVAAAITYNASSNTAKLAPSAMLVNSTVYTATIKGGTSGVKDLAGNPLASDYTWSFTSSPFLAPTEGYGGPILVISSAANPFSRYTAELLRAEGLNEFKAKDISSVTADDLTHYDVVVLGEMQVTADQVNMLRNWVNEGGVLIAFRPTDLLAPLFGISNAGGVLADKYLLVNTSSGPGVGIVNETIQFHGEANLHSLNGATSLAALYSAAGTATTNPAVTTINVGSNGGKAIAFTYDLARSVVYTRQGNPAWSGQERDGQTPIRADDMFFGLPANTGADWVDLNKIAIPQADEQQRLLANIIIQNNLHNKPLPRLWYLPRGWKAAVVMTGDDHANNGTTGRFNHYLTLGPNTPADVADWNAIRSTSYIYPNTPISNSQAAAFEAQGFEIALHPTTNCTNFTAPSLENVMSSQLASLKSALPGISVPVTNRTHCMAWSDWATHAKAEASHGLRLDVNYYYWPATWVQNRPGMFTGSGMPMRFADTDGTLIDCYQVTTQMTDESGIDYASFCDQLLDKATGPEGFYGTFCANMHTDSANHIGSSAIIASAIAHKIPVISSKQLLTWLDGRNNSFFDSITWDNHQLRFRINAPAGARNLMGMLPRYIGTADLLSITSNGSSVWANVDTIKGMQYVFFYVAFGDNSYVANYAAEPSVTIHPVSQTICSGNTVTLSSAANGNPPPSVQWQQSDDGTTWVNISGANTSPLSFTATTSLNNKQYRAVWTNSTGTVNSNAAVLTVRPLSELSSTLSPPAVLSGTVFSYTPASTIAGTSFAWTRAAVPGISNPFGSGTGSINETLINTTNDAVIVTYVYKLEVNGCTNTQQVMVKIEPEPEPDGCRFNTSITASFNGTSIAAGRYIWFNSVFKPGNARTGPVNFYVSNSKISYTLNGQLITLDVPDAHIRYASDITAASTRYINDAWETQVPLNNNGNAFLTGLSYRLTQKLPGGVRVTWTADIEIDKENITLDWKWTAGVYTNFAANAGLNVKPTDGILNILNPIVGIGNAGTPLNYTLSIAPGAMGAGLINIVSTYSSIKRETCSGQSRLSPSGLVAKQSSMQQKDQPLPETQMLNQELNVRVTPNPGTSYFNMMINSGNANPVTVRILDMSGKEIGKFEKLPSTGVLRLGNNWASGTYFAEVIQGDQRKIIKMIKVN